MSKEAKLMTLIGTLGVTIAYLAWQYPMNTQPNNQSNSNNPPSFTPPRPFNENGTVRNQNSNRNDNTPRNRNSNDNTSPPPPPPSKAEQKPLDNTVGIISADQCWEYQAKPISIGGKMFESYGVFSHGCTSTVAMTFDIRGWDRFEGFAGIADSHASSNTLTIKVDDGEPRGAFQLFYNKSASPLRIILKGHKTLTFERTGRYPLIVIGEPMLFRGN